jgi:hypothetical protein
VADCLVAGLTSVLHSTYSEGKLFLRFEKQPQRLLLGVERRMRDFD